MKYEWFDGYCLSKTGAVKDYKAEWEAERFMVGQKMFCMKGGDKHGRPIVTLKCEPAFGQMLREKYPDIIPGYYMNKAHWNSVYLEGGVPDEVLRQMADMSYSLIFAALPQKLQKEIQGE